MPRFLEISAGLFSRSLMAMAAASALVGVSAPGAIASAYAQGAQAEPASPQTVSRAELQAAIDKLGDLDYASRTTAARTIRRTSVEQAVPALIQAVGEHQDGYVRYRALVLLTGFNDPRTTDVMRAALTSPNDRLRTVAYSFFEHRPDRAMVPDFLAALDKELGEFVRPTLVRTLAAHSVVVDDRRLRDTLLGEVGRGEDYFRSAVIEALGDYKARFAYDALVEVARREGPLQDDAVLALGKIGDSRALDLMSTLQRSAPRRTQPLVATAICLLEPKCSGQIDYLAEALKFADANGGQQDVLRGAATGLAALAVAGGHDAALDALFEAGMSTREATHAPVALALATVALRSTPLMLTALAARPQAIDVVADGFDMLEEDLDKEIFFAAVRRAYWNAPEGSPTRSLMQTLIGKLDF